jgi:hypothetical protein
MGGRRASGPVERWDLGAGEPCSALLHCEILYRAVDESGAVIMLWRTACDPNPAAMTPLATPRGLSHGTPDAPLLHIA